MKDSTASLWRTSAAQLRRGALWTLFALVLIVPKVKRLRRHRREWNFARIIAVCAGAAMLGLGIARGQAPTLLVAGAMILSLALLLNPAPPEISVDARARELGALIVVDGGRYIDTEGSRHRAKLFIGSDRLWALDAALYVLLEVRLQQIRAVFVEQAGAGWSFRVDCQQTKSEFIYEGCFAEHLARVADATVRGRLHRELAVLR